VAILQVLRVVRWTKTGYTCVCQWERERNPILLLAMIQNYDIDEETCATHI